MVHIFFRFLKVVFYELNFLCGAGTVGAHPRSLLARGLGVEGCLLRVKLSLVRRDRWDAPAQPSGAWSGSFGLSSTSKIVFVVQGPLGRTRAAFWHMVWEQRVVFYVLNCLWCACRDRWGALAQPSGTWSGSVGLSSMS